MIKILHVLSALNSGGIESMLFNYYKRMNTSEICFDFVAHEANGDLLEKEFEYLGCKIFHIPSQRKSIKKNKQGLKAILKNNSYDIIHFHHGVLSLGIGIAKKYAPNAKIVLHSHTTFEPNKVIRILKPFLRKYLISRADYYCACGEAASNFLYGIKFGNREEIKIIRNAINANIFSYNKQYRTEIREQFSITNNCFIIGTVGRFNYAKNPFFIVEIVKEISKNFTDFKFLWVGDGELKTETERLVKEKNLQNYFIFAGLRKDTYKFYNAFDAFILPSKYEGLPVAGIEAQCNGVPCLLSDKVPKETAISDNCWSLPLNVFYWKNKLLELSENNFRMPGNEKLIKSAGYDIQTESKKLEDFYKKIVGEY